MGLGRPIRIGEIDYANAWPLFHGLAEQGECGDDRYELVARVPARLNGLLSEGKLDVSAISSFSYGQYSEQYRLLPGLSVGSVGKVHSILLFLKQPIHIAKPKRIALTSASATSVNLLKIIMALRFECTPDYITTEPVLDEMLQHADAALLIGDPAIRASWLSHGLYVMDLGELWHDWTGLGMTYAVVAARREMIEREPELVDAVWSMLLEAKRDNLSHVEDLIMHACTRIGGSQPYWTTYFRSLQYDFDARLQDGLSLYFRYATQLGLLQQETNIAFFEEQSAHKVNE
ncbi:menaquinone biosynthesis protein [Paenibacillus sp. J5C_2022]|uniref:menaquinone biosynthesis protein n=1 Tax=Paenibacillus sp. J5C2022 TaxID=2977129 RepID=UPI0021D257A6|nr:menaquinone biosynthesis protein [Paenibacillus sp. J5C2022]MCU6708358.1 menaquinone biosynthesis protein [Paenibacillus sp. J5C2022]